MSPLLQARAKSMERTPLAVIQESDAVRIPDSEDEEKE